MMMMMIAKGRLLQLLHETVRMKVYPLQVLPPYLRHQIRHIVRFTIFFLASELSTSTSFFIPGSFFTLVLKQFYQAHLLCCYEPSRTIHHSQTMEPGDRSPSKLLENYLGHLAYGRQLFPSSATVESPSNSMTATSVPASATTTAAAHPPGLGRLTLQEQQQEQQASNRRASNSTQLPQSAEPVAASHSSNETENENFRQNSFLLNLYVALQEASFPKALGWSDDGKAFYANQEDPTFLTLLRKNFKRESNQNRCHLDRPRWILLEQTHVSWILSM